MLKLFETDRVLRRYLSHVLQDSYKETEKLLSSFAQICETEIIPLSEQAEKHPPELVQYDPDGNRIDEIVYHPAYTAMEKIAYEYGVIWRFYEEPLRNKRIIGFSLGYLFGQSEAGLFCPICMTDGAAYVLKRYASSDIQQRFVPHLLAKQREELFQGAMFLTEKQGGSDVGLTETEAVPEGDSFKLYGEKWFCSNVDAECILTLARERGAPKGTRGLSLFALPRFLENGERNSYLINRLKDKLGTRSMPTAEVKLEGALAYQIGEAGKGFKMMTDMLNVSRLYNAVGSIAAMHRAYLESTQRAHERVAFGKLIEQHPLMKRKLLEMATEHEASFYLVFAAIACMDHILAGIASDSERKLLRILTPLTKYFTARKAITLASEATEILGGNGYVETFSTARILRDAQVLSIWEGTTNILVLDTFRAIAKEQAHETLLEKISEKLEHIEKSWLLPFKEDTLRLQEQIRQALPLFASDFEQLSFYGQDLTDGLVRLFEAAEWLSLEEDISQEEEHRETIEFFFSFLLPPAVAGVKRINQTFAHEAVV